MEVRGKGGPERGAARGALWGEEAVIEPVNARGARDEPPGPGWPVKGISHPERRLDEAAKTGVVLPAPGGGEGDELGQGHGATPARAGGFPSTASVSASASVSVSVSASASASCNVDPRSRRR